MDVTYLGPNDGFSDERKVSAFENCSAGSTVTTYQLQNEGSGPHQRGLGWGRQEGR